jgi:hypothetical protein
MIDVTYVSNYFKNTIIHHILFDGKNIFQGEFLKEIDVFDFIKI